LPFAINNRGEITGFVYDKNPNIGCTFHWASGIFETIGPCPGSGYEGIGATINDRGQIIGRDCLLYDHGTVRTTIEYLIEDKFAVHGQCYAINKSGQIAGANGRIIPQPNLSKKP